MNKPTKQGLTKNNLELIFTVGLPGSSKSTWAKEKQREGFGKYKIVDKDSIREMLDQSEWSKQNEQFVLKVRDFIIEQSLSDGYSVIVHDTNLVTKHHERFKEIAAKFSAKLIKNDSFLEVPVEECIKRDLRRTNSVGKDIIMDMYKKFICKVPKNPEYIEQYEGLQPVIVCDLDGTLCLMNGKRGPYEQEKVYDDDVNVPVKEQLESFLDGYCGGKIIFLSGREDKGSCRKDTLRWLNDKTDLREGQFELIMRKNGDLRKDSIVKKELAEKHILHRYFVKAWYDDRDQVVSMVRNELKLPCFQVYWGDF